MDYVEKLRAKALLALAPVLLLLAGLALVPSSAMATQIVPAATEIVATAPANTAFIPENAFAPSSVQCKKSTATGTTPTAGATLNNTNRGPGDPGGAVGTFSTGPGSVLMTVTPKFEECEIYVRAGGAWVPSGIAATVTVSTANGNWTFAVDRYEAAVEANDIVGASFGVPKSGAKISFTTETGVCTLNVSSNAATAVMGRWTNNNPSSVNVDGQINFTDEPAGCSGFATANPAQFEGIYNVKTALGGNVTVNR